MAMSYGTLNFARWVDAVLDHRAAVDLGAGLERQHGEADFAPLVVGHTDDGCLGNCGQLVEDVLDLGRVDVFTTGDVHVLPAIDDEDETLVVGLRGIAGLQPATFERRLPWRRVGSSSQV